MSTNEEEQNRFRLDIVLADMVRVAERKLDTLGIGWQYAVLGASMGAGVVIGVPLSETNKRHEFSLKLEDVDGHPVMVATPDGGFAPFEISGNFEVGGPPGIQPGTAQASAMPPLNLPPNSLPLKPGRRYRFTAFINNQTNPMWQRSFGVMAPLL